MSCVRLFELFSQGTSGPTDAGLGIGLWLAKTRTEMHGGTFEPRAMGSAKVPSACGVILLAGDWF
jgi:signal transduction histidine kinase